MPKRDSLPSPDARASDARAARLSAAPLFHRVYLTLVERLDQGLYAAGAAIPGETELAGEFGVSRITARRAILDLVAEGRLERWRGKGTFVAGAAQDGPAPARLSLARQLEQTARDTRVRVVEFKYVAAPADVADAMHLARQSRVQYSRRLRLRKGVPAILLDAYVPEALGRHYTSRDLRDKALHECLAGAGARLARVVQHFSGSVATPAFATLLEVPFGTPLGQIERVGYNAKGQAIQFLRLLFVPSRARMRMEITSEDGERADAGMFVFS